MTAHAGRRVAGLSCLAAGVLPLIAVANPALFDVWAADPAQALAIEAAHHGAWLFTTWLLAAGFGASVPAVVTIAGLLEGVIVRVATAVHLIGAGLLTVTTVFGVTVRADLLGAPIPDWYLPISRWLDGLDTTALGLLWPLAQLLLGLIVVRTRAVPVWAGWVLVAAGVVVLAQLAAFGGVIPAPMFIAWVVLGVATLAGARPARRPAHQTTP